MDIKTFKRNLAKRDTVKKIENVLETQQNQEDSYFDSLNSVKDFKDAQSHQNFHLPKKIVIHTKKNLEIIKQKTLIEAQEQ